MQTSIFEQVQLALDMALRLDHFPPDEEIKGPEPKKAFVDSIRRDGVRSPIIVQPSKPYWMIKDGGRRIKAARKCGHNTIMAVIVPEGVEFPDINVAMNELREKNRQMRLEQVSRLLHSGMSEAEVAKQLHLERRYVEEDAKILKLDPRIYAQYMRNRISEAALRALSKRTKREQTLAVDLIEEGEKITVSKVQEIRQVATREYEAAHPSIFTMPELAGFSYVRNARARTDGVDVTVLVGGEEQTVKLSVDQILKMGGKHGGENSTQPNVA